MPHVVITNAANVSIPWQPSLVSGLNSRTIVASGTSVTLSDVEFAALSSTAFTSGTLLDGGDTTTGQIAGIKVPRPTAGLPQTATTGIFTVANGRVWIMNLIATVTTAVQAQATLVKVVYTPTGQSVHDLTASTTDWTAATVGTQFSAKLSAITDVLTANLPASGAIFGGVEAQQPQVLLNPGVISVNTVASSTGQAKWDLWYVPVDPGAVVTPL